jgi:hypothetical protein
MRASSHTGRWWPPDAHDVRLSGSGSGGPAVTAPDRRRGTECLESLPDLWAKTSDAGREAIAEAVFERIDVLAVTDYTFTLTAHAKARGWDAAFGRAPSA